MSEPNPTDPAPPAPTSVDTWRNSLYWYFTAGPGLVIQCRHLALSGLMAVGAIPLPVIDAIKQFWGSELTTRQAMDIKERREELIAIARYYACAVAVSPRIVLTAAEAAPDALTCVELGDPLLLDLFNDGMRRRLAAAPALVDTFRPAAPANGAAAGSDGAAVSPSAELLVRPLADVRH